MKQSLQRTRKMMAEQLARVAQVSEVMGEQDALLMNTFAEHQASPTARCSAAFCCLTWPLAFRMLLRYVVVLTSLCFLTDGAGAFFALGLVWVCLRVHPVCTARFASAVTGEERVKRQES